MDQSAKEIQRLEKEISRPDFWQDREEAKAVGKQYEDLKAEYRQWFDLKNEVDELSALAKLSGADEKMQKEIEKKLSKLQTEFKKMEFAVLFSGAEDKGGAILSIHAGTGGVDAQDWAEILLRMYLRFCEKRGFEAKIVDEVIGSEAGLKSVMLEIIGRYAYGWLKSENGVHRLVRISPFDAEKMRHTSFALVEVLPEIEDAKTIELKDEDLKIEVMRASGHGGQSVNTTDSAVRLTHLPTKISVKCQNERSQAQNKKNALKILKVKLLKYYEAAESENLKNFKGEYRQAEWGNQARSYVMQPYQLVKDHRTEHETPEINRILGGELDDFIASYLRFKAKK